MYVLVVAISGGDVVATSVVAKSAPSHSLRPIAVRAAWSILLLILLLSTLHNLHFEWQARNGVFKYDIRTEGAGGGVVKI